MVLDFAMLVSSQARPMDLLFLDGVLGQAADTVGKPRESLCENLGSWIIRISIAKSTY